VASVTALNLPAAALRAEGRGLPAFEAELGRLARLAVDAAGWRRATLERHGEAPGATLYPLGRGPVPRVDLQRARHLVEPVGLDRARTVLGEGDPERFRARTLGRLEAALAPLAAERGLSIRVAEGLPGGAAGRLARLDRARFPETEAWWGEEPSYAALPPEPGRDAREPVLFDRTRGVPGFHRLRHRVDTGARAPVEGLLARLEAAAGDASVVEYALEPWPHRVVTGSEGEP
jgi:hypothetical protein